MTIVKLFRWIIFIPLSLICGFFVRIISGFFFVKVYVLFAGIEKQGLMNLLTELPATFLFGAAATYFAIKIAPSNKKIAALIMTIILIVITGFSLSWILSPENYDIFDYIYSFAFVFGSAIVTYFAFKKV